MRLSALEIKKKEFQQKMRGIDQEEVQNFLEEVSREVDMLTHEKIDLQERLKDAQLRLDHFLSLEHTLEKTLVAAQSTALKMEEQAKREADLILQSAKLERDRALTDIRAEMERVNSDLFHLRAEHDATLVRLRSLHQGFQQFLDSIERSKYDRSAPSQQQYHQPTYPQHTPSPAYQPQSTPSPLQQQPLQQPEYPADKTNVNYAANVSSSAPLAEPLPPQGTETNTTSSLA